MPSHQFEHSQRLFGVQWIWNSKSFRQIVSRGQCACGKRSGDGGGGEKKSSVRLEVTLPRVLIFDQMRSVQAPIRMQKTLKDLHCKFHFLNGKWSSVAFMQHEDRSPSLPLPLYISEAGKNQQLCNGSETAAECFHKFDFIFSMERLKSIISVSRVSILIHN